MAAKNKPLINGTSYSWSQIDCNLLGRTATGITQINWKANQDKQNNYGRGNQPVSRGNGNKTYEGSIRFTMEEYMALQNALAPGKTILDVKPFPVVIAWLNEDNQKIVVILEFVEFMAFGVDTSSGDMQTEVELPLVIGNIRHLK